jgi:hypothetical protein
MEKIPIHKGAQELGKRSWESRKKKFGGSSEAMSYVRKKGIQRKTQWINTLSTFFGEGLL